MEKITILGDLMSDVADLAADEFMLVNAARLISLGMGAYPVNYRNASSNSAKLNMYRSLTIRLRADLDMLLAEERRKNPVKVSAPKAVVGPKITAETRITRATDAVEVPKRGRKAKAKVKLADLSEEAAKIGAAFRIPAGPVEIAAYVPVPAHKRSGARVAFFSDVRRVPCTQTGLADSVLEKLSAADARRVVAPKKEVLDGTYKYDPRAVIHRHRNLLASNPVARRILEAYEVHKVIGAPVALDMFIRAINEEHQHAMGRKPKRSLFEHNPRLMFDHRLSARKDLPGLPNEEDRLRRAIEGIIAAGEIATFNPKRHGGTFDNRWKAIEFDRPEPERQDVVVYQTKGNKADEKANRLLGAMPEPKVKMRQIPKRA